MVFVYVPIRHSPTIEPTREEQATMRDLQARGLEGESLERALVAAGVAPERARLLVEAAGAPTAAVLRRAFTAALAMAALGLVFALLAAPLREEFTRRWPGAGRLVGLLAPLVLVFALLLVFARRRRAA